MPRYKFKISTPDGNISEKILTASNKASLKAQLEKDGNFILNIQREEGFSSFIKNGTTRRGVKLKDLLVFNQEFSVLLKAGLPIVQALNAIIEKGGTNELTKALTVIRKDISGGASLSEAFRNYSHMFSNLYIASLQAGETSGNIGLAITRYIDYMKKISEIRQKVISASVYPIILTIVSIFTVLFLLIYIVPSFTKTYFEAGTQLPGITLILVNTTEFLRSNATYMILFFLAIIIGYHYSKRTEAGKAYLDELKLKIPFWGSLYINYSISRLTRTLATILRGGIPLVESIRISSGTITNTYLKSKLEEAANNLEKGAGFAESLSNTNTFPNLALRMLEAGEMSGTLEEVLDDVADFYESDIDMKISILTSSIEPALMVVMGLLIGFIVLAMYMPIFKMAGTIG
ncbi:MAG: type II secretion system F family protein [Candidatus Thorarchaeota archaeon]